MVDKTAPATAGRPSAGSRTASAPIAPIVAVLDTNPEANPAIGNPKRGPSKRTAMYPPALIDIIRITIFQTVRGLTAPNGPR